MAGCTSGGSSAASPPASPRADAASEAASATASSAASANATAASSAASASPSASASSTAPTACATSSLSAKAGLAQGTAGSIYQVIDFTNISNAPCSLYGYPGVSLASGASATQATQVGAAASRSTASAATLVTLGPGQTANALLQIVEAGNYPSATCTPVTTSYLQIYPPNQTTPIYLGYQSTGCASSSVDLLWVSVVKPGTGG